MPLGDIRGRCQTWLLIRSLLKRVGRSADLKISKSALHSLNHFIFLNTEPIQTTLSFMESLLNYLAFEMKNNMVDLLQWQQQITYS